MIPLQIQIKNFLSYGPDMQTIDFAAYPLICLSGKNGHGKSALLDAITWALWGQARKTTGTAKADEGLLRLGQTIMMVVLDFECNSQHYRVKREFAQTYGKPYANLEFGVFDAEKNAFVPLTDKTIRLTQSRINQTLAIDFDSFINSAFLRQGQANEFSKKTPKERKEILASILGLNRYEVIRKLASEKIKHAQTEKKALAMIQEKEEIELARRPELEKEKMIICEHIQSRVDEQKKAQSNHDIIQKKKNELTAAKQQKELLEYQLKQFKEEKEAGNTTLSTEFKSWREVHRLLLKRHNPLEFEKRKQEVAKQLQVYQTKLEEHLQAEQSLIIHQKIANERSYELEKQYTKKRNDQQLTVERIQLQIKQEKNKIETLQKKENKIAHERSEIEIKVKEIEQQLPKDKNEIIVLKKTFEKRKEYYQQWVAQGNMLTAQKAEVKQKHTMVNGESPACPLCEQNLSLSRRRFLKNKFDVDTHTLDHKIARYQRIIPRLKTILVAHHEQLQCIEKNVLLQNELKTQLERAINDLKVVTDERKHIQGVVATLEKQFETEDKKLQALVQEKQTLFLHDAVYQKNEDEIKHIKNRIATIQYQKETHEKIQKKQVDIEKEATILGDIEKMVAKQEQKKEVISQLCQQLKKVNKKTKELTDKLKQFSYLEKEEHELGLAQKDADNRDKRIQLEKEELLQKKGNIEAQLKKIDQISLDHKAHKTQLSALNAMIDEYYIIAQATGKDGIQALLIEEIIPEIEQEANDLLSRLTDNQTQLFIESVKDLKKGGTKETLDIKISDSIGIRPYEMFSGGEAFRIDFALRIAISKLLARRSGTALQTLIIDEGFGSQDEEGLSLIMDALYKIQDDFDKIIIVSHLPAMKNQFPIHFFVEKKPQGSMIKVIEQG